MLSSKKTKLLLLDRDGTINVDLGSTYVSDPAQIELIAGAGRAIGRARAAGYKIAVITNQAGVAKGLTRLEELPRIHRRLEELVGAEAALDGFCFDEIQVCPHHPKDECACRKPKPKMALEAIARLGADAANCVFIGDKMADLGCAAQAGVRSILVLTGHGRETERECQALGLQPTLGVAPTLSEAIDIVLEHS